MLRRMWERGMWGKPEEITKKAEKDRIKREKRERKKAEKEFKNKKKAEKEAEKEAEKKAEEERVRKLEEWAEEYRRKGYGKWEAMERALEREKLEKRKRELEKIALLTPEGLLKKERETYLKLVEQYEKKASTITEKEEKSRFIRQAKLMRELADTLTEEAQLKKAQKDHVAEFPPPGITEWKYTYEAKMRERKIEEARKQLEKIKERLKEYT
jgi:DNA repair exonuclease SbcCD ATPase subunit